jgi:hypothetical protein
MHYYDIALFFLQYQSKTPRIKITQMSNQLIIHLTDEQLKIIKNHLKKQNEINSKEETFSGFSFTLSCTELGISWLDLEMNSKIEIGDVNWEFK